MGEPDRRVEIWTKLFPHLSEKFISATIKKLDRELERIAEDRRLAWMKD